MIYTDAGPRWLTYRERRTDVDPLRDHRPRYAYALQAWEPYDGHFMTTELDGRLVGRCATRNEETQEEMDRAIQDARTLLTDALGTAYLDWQAQGWLEYLFNGGTLELFVDFPLTFPLEFVELA